MRTNTTINTPGSSACRLAARCAPLPGDGRRAAVSEHVKVWKGKGRGNRPTSVAKMAGFSGLGYLCHTPAWINSNGKLRRQDHEPEGAIPLLGSASYLNTEILRQIRIAATDDGDRNWSARKITAEISPTQSTKRPQKSGHVSGFFSYFSRSRPCWPQTPWFHRYDTICRLLTLPVCIRPALHAIPPCFCASCRLGCGSLPFLVVRAEEEWPVPCALRPELSARPGLVTHRPRLRFRPTGVGSRKAGQQQSSALIAPRTIPSSIW
jgi:hypothetical protein